MIIASSNRLIPYIRTVRVAILIMSLSTCLVGCGVKAESVPPMDLAAAQQLAGVTETSKVNVQKGAYEQVLALVDAIPDEANKAMITPAKERVAGQKANLVALGMEFEPAIRKLVEGGPWEIPTGITPEMGFEARYELVDDLFAELAKLKVAAKMLNAYAQVVEEGGNPELAARAYLTNRLLAQRIIEASPMQVSHLVGVADSAIAERGIRDMALRRSWTSADIQLLQGKGTVPFGAIKGLAGAIRSEWTNFSVPFIAEFKFPFNQDDGAEFLYGIDKEALAVLNQNPKPFDRKLTLEMGSKFIEITAEEMEKTPMRSAMSDSYYEEILGAVPTEETDKKKMLEWFKSTPNALGYALLQTAFPTFGQARLASLRNEATRGLTEVVLAARRGMVETGDLPVSYSDLKKFGLPADVVDPFSGKGYGYDASRGMAWSVGADGKDDGGKDEPERWTDKAKDWVVRLK